jgi:hypothetical protein
VVTTFAWPPSMGEFMGIAGSPPRRPVDSEPTNV